MAINEGRAPAPPGAGSAGAVSETTVSLDQKPDQQDMAQRGEPDTPATREASLTAWQNRVLAAERYWEPVFKRMRQNMELARTGATKEWFQSDQYTVNLINRHINNKVARLYAKNPTIVVKPRDRIFFQHWNGNADALMATQNPNAGPAEMAQAGLLMQDIDRGMQEIEILRRVSKTLKIVLEYYWGEQQPGFKKLLKKLVRRACITGVGYVQIGYQRLMEPRPGVASEIADKMRQVQHLRRLAADLHDEESDNVERDIYEMEKGIEALRSEEEVITREGLVHDFPHSTMIIPDPATVDLATWTGTNWIARKYFMTPSRIQELFNKDVGSSYKRHIEQGVGRHATYYKRLSPDDYHRSEDGLAAVYQIQDRSTGTVRWICEGYNDYLSEPQAPDCTLEGFFDIKVLTFNDIEHDRHIYPLSDVDFMRHPQAEFNRSRESLRQHRWANRPGWVMMSGAMSADDRNAFQDREAHDVTELDAVNQVSKISELMEPTPTSPIDPALYETNGPMQDIQLTVGSQEAQFGATSGSTATEAAIAEQSSTQSTTADIDELDTLLSCLANMGGQILLQHLTPETAKKIAGVGAVWPDLSGLEIAEQMQIEVEAGSSGRPNRAADAAMMERILPYIIQLPGIDPVWLARQVLQRFDANLDLDAAFASGIPSISSMNAMAGSAMPGTGGGGVAPEAAMQGPEGAQNQPVPDQVPEAAGANAATFPVAPEQVGNA